MLRTLADRHGAPPDPRRSTEAEDVALIRRVMRAASSPPSRRSIAATTHRLQRFIGLITPQPPIVEEVLNDTMLVVWNRAATFNGQSKVSTWVFSIAYRTALKALRGHDEPVEPPEADRCPSPSPGPSSTAPPRRLGPRWRGRWTASRTSSAAFSSSPTSTTCPMPRSRRSSAARSTP